MAVPYTTQQQAALCRLRTSTIKVAANAQLAGLPRKILVNMAPAALRPSRFSKRQPEAALVAIRNCNMALPGSAIGCARLVLLGSYQVATDTVRIRELGHQPCAQLHIIRVSRKCTSRPRVKTCPAPFFCSGIVISSCLYASHAYFSFQMDG